MILVAHIASSVCGAALQAVLADALRQTGQASKPGRPFGNNLAVAGLTIVIEA
jgi:hypothetical protein